MRVTLDRQFHWKRTGNVLIVEGLALHPGTFTGIDGHTVKYEKSLFSSDNIVLVDRRIKLGHRIDDESVVGFITGWDLKSDGLYIRGYVFDDEAIKAIENGTRGFSIEANVTVDENYRAQKVEITAVSLVEYPAAPLAGVMNTKFVALLSKKNSENEKGENRMEETQVKDAKKEKPTKKEFLDWIKKQLKDAGIPDDVCETVMDVLDKAIKTPYPYPYPAPTKMEDMKAKLESLEKEKEELTKVKAELEARVKELEDTLKSQEIEAKIALAREFDPNFDPKTVISDDMTHEAKLAALDAYIKGAKVKLSVSEKKEDPDAELKAKVSEILRELGVGE